MADVAKLQATCDKPVEKQEENLPDETNFHPGQSPQGQSSGNVHHDSEYDTASELEGGEEDDYEDEEDDSLGADEEDDLDSEEGGSIDFDSEQRQRGDGQEQNEFSKKVDEDRSNPQYIPKRGTFYEHDDRTADEPEDSAKKVEEGGDGETTKSQTPITSSASKTMKKWQPASAVDRWSHDRYDEHEQAPKSRAELVSAYGYDIRSEDGPPRARRRRRYGRGPNRYVRNWEDESAYIKSSALQRKPRPEDFPALGDREKKNRKNRSFREEKENRYDRHNDKISGGGGGGHRNNMNNSHRDRDRDNRNSERRSSGKSFRQGRQSMEFKNQSKNRSNDGRLSFNREHDGRHISDDRKTQVESVSFTNTKASSSTHIDNRFNGHDGMNVQSKTQIHHDVKDKIPMNAHPLTNRQTQQLQPQPQQQSQIQTRLQQIQSRNEPSHVGNVQIHSIVPQNPNANVSEMAQPSSEGGRAAKRYSNLRQRSQGESNLPQNSQLDQLQKIQQLHDHHQQTQSQAQQHVLLQDQHLLQANLMQLYHSQQENLQAQMQGVTIQSIPTVPTVPTVPSVQTGHQSKTQYQNVQQQYQSSSPAAPTYYASTNEYPPAPQPQAIQPQYGQQQQATYIQQQPSAPQITFNAQTPSAGPPPSQPIPSTLNYVQNSPTSNTAAPYQNFSNFQNYNTVGGTTYFVPQQQPPSRTVVPPQRRPTNAIPILAPPTNDKSKKSEKDDESKSGVPAPSSANAPVGSAENIDHILDNMFVQRPPYQPPTRKSSSPASETAGTSTPATTPISAPVASTITPASTGEDRPPSTNTEQSPPPSVGVTNPSSVVVNQASKPTNPFDSQLAEEIKKISLGDEKVNPEEGSGTETSQDVITNSETG